MDTLVWNTLHATERDLYLTLLWLDGYSEGAIAKFLSATKGQIVGRRRILKLANSGRPPRKDIKHIVNPERLQDLLDVEAMDDLADRGVVSIAPPPAKKVKRVVKQKRVKKPSSLPLELPIVEKPEEVVPVSETVVVAEPATPPSEPEPEEPEEEVVPVSKIVPLPEVEQLPDTCQWPLGTRIGKEPKMCGKPVVPGHKLCEEHLFNARRILK